VLRSASHNFVPVLIDHAMFYSIMLHFFYLKAYWFLFVFFRNIEILQQQEMDNADVSILRSGAIFLDRQAYLVSEHIGAHKNELFYVSVILGSNSIGLICHRLVVYNKYFSTHRQQIEPMEFEPYW